MSSCRATNAKARAAGAVHEIASQGIATIRTMCGGLFTWRNSQPEPQHELADYIGDDVRVTCLGCLANEIPSMEDR